jgi:hypothetical protein
MSQAIDELNDGFSVLLETGGDNALIVTPQGNSEVKRAVKVLFEAPVGVWGGEGYVMTAPVATIRSSDVPKNQRGSLLIIGSTYYNINKCEPDSLGTSRLTLAETVQPTPTRGKFRMTAQDGTTQTNVGAVSVDGTKTLSVE